MNCERADPPVNQAGSFSVPGSTGASPVAVGALADCFPSRNRNWKRFEDVVGGGADHNTRGRVCSPDHGSATLDFSTYMDDVVFMTDTDLCRRIGKKRQKVLIAGSSVLILLFLTSVVLHYREQDPKMIKVFENVMVVSATLISILLIGLLKKAKYQKTNSN